MKFSDEYFNKHNWEDIQKFYNENHTWKEILKKFNISNEGLSLSIKRGLFKTRGRSESVKNWLRNNPRKHSDETKKKLSEIRKKYLKENPDKVPYLLNHSSKESYPEKYFTEVFTNENINVIKYYRIGIYELDFCIPEKKIDIEIDGNQHYDDIKISESDKRRNLFLENDGWDIIRIKWSDYQRMATYEKALYIKNIKEYIDDLIDIKPSIKLKEKTKSYTKCLICRENCSTNRCRKCYLLQSRKVERPSIEQLESDIKQLGYKGTGRKYGVSDNSIRKWIKIK